MTTLRTQLDLANSTIGVLRETRDQAMLSHMRFARPDYVPAPLLGPSAFGAAYPPPPPAFSQPNFSDAGGDAGALGPPSPGFAPRHPTAPPTAPRRHRRHTPGAARRSVHPVPARVERRARVLTPRPRRGEGRGGRRRAAEARGRESLVRLEAMAARAERPPALDLGVKEATSEGGETVEEEEEGAWGAKRETPWRRGDY